jgi:hypothetical protein
MLQARSDVQKIRNWCFHLFLGLLISPCPLWLQKTLSLVVDPNYLQTYFYSVLNITHDSLVVEALCYKLESHELETQGGICTFYFFYLPNHFSPTWPWGLLASNRNEYQKHKNVSGE